MQTTASERFSRRRTCVVRTAGYLLTASIDYLLAARGKQTYRTVFEALFTAQRVLSASRCILLTLRLAARE